MFGLNDYVIVTVVNALAADEKKPTNHFDVASDVRTAALNSIQATTGNQHSRTNIQKQAYKPSRVTTVRQAYGLTGTRYATHLPYRNGKLIDLDDAVLKNSEIMLIREGLSVRHAVQTASCHRVIPNRLGS
jgi:hypothetical protein